MSRECQCQAARALGMSDGSVDSDYPKELRGAFRTFAGAVGPFDEGFATFEERHPTLKGPYLRERVALESKTNVFVFALCFRSCITPSVCVTSVILAVSGESLSPQSIFFNVLSHQFDRDYVIDTLPDNQPLYRPNGSKIFVRHPLNDRKQLATVEMYKKMFLEHGVVKDARAGRPVCVPTTLGRANWILQLMGAATFMETMYICCEEFPEHEFVLHLLGESGGVSGVQLVNPRAPRDALKYIMQEGNKLVGIGASTSFFELLKEIPEIEEARKKAIRNKRALEATDPNDNGEGPPSKTQKLQKPPETDATEADEGTKADVEGLQPENGKRPLETDATGADDAPQRKKQKRSQAGYETDYWNWLSEVYPLRYGSWAEFDKAKGSYHKLVKRSLWGPMSEYCGTSCEYHCKDLNSSRVFSIFSQILKVITDSRHTSAVLELLKMAVPTNDEVPWVFRQVGDLAGLEDLLEDMKESVIFKKAAEMAAKDKDSSPESKNQKPARAVARGKGKEAAKAKGKKQSGKSDSIKLTVADEDGSQTGALFLDDVLNSIDYALRDTPAEKVNLKEKRACIRLGMLMGMRKALFNATSKHPATQAS